MDGQPAYDTRFKVVVERAPRTAIRNLQMMLGANGSYKQDENVFTGTCEYRRAYKILDGITVLREGDKWDIHLEMSRNGQPLDLAVVAASNPDIPAPEMRLPPMPPAPTEAPSRPLTTPRGVPAAPRAPLPAPASPAPPGPMTRAPRTDEMLVGTSVPWPYGDVYRPEDAGKLDTIARKPRSRKEGKLKIQLGRNQDHQYLVEPNRGPEGGWVASRLQREGDRQRIAHDAEFRRCVYAIQKDMQDRASAVLMLSRTAPAEPPDTTPRPIPVAPFASVPMPQAAAAPQGVAPSVGPRPSFALWTLGAGEAPGTTRWCATGTDGSRYESEDLELLLYQLHEASGGNRVVIGWDGQRPPPRVVPEVLPALPAVDPELLALGQALQELEEENEDWAVPPPVAQPSSEPGESAGPQPQLQPEEAQ